MEKGTFRSGKGSSDSGKGSSYRGGNDAGKKTSKQVVKKRQPTLFGLPGFDVSVNKIDKKTKKVIKGKMWLLVVKEMCFQNF